MKTALLAFALAGCSQTASGAPTPTSVEAGKGGPGSITLKKQ